MSATFVQTPELTGTIHPTTATGIVTPGWGIDATLSGFIIQSANVSYSRSTDITQDQRGAEIGELDYDQRWDLTLDVIGNPPTADIDDWEDAQIPVQVGDTQFSFNGHKWKVDSVTYAGSFQDKKRWSIVGHRFPNFPPQ